MTEKERNYQLRILPSAQHELEEIALLHKALSGSASARKVTDGLFDAMHRLTLFPLSAPTIREAELRRMGFRYAISGQYLIFYRLIGDTVFVYHIVHGKTDYPTLLRGEFL